MSVIFIDEECVSFPKVAVDPHSKVVEAYPGELDNKLYFCWPLFTCKDAEYNLSFVKLYVFPDPWNCWGVPPELP